ncbi:MAG: dienelactone hydrolase family protein [Actinomycetota bacterium]|nr:dienelactone hydrolase family protein [Actinomycetota bacterium]
MEKTARHTFSDELSLSVGGRSASALWRGAAGAVAAAVVAHGAGNDMRHPLFEGIADGLAAENVSTLRFNFPYAEDGRRAPDRPAVLMEAWRAALELAQDRAGDAPLVASGKSLGGRMASMVAAEDGETFAGRGLVFFGYPLHAPGKTDQLRDHHLPAVRVPMLFIQGDADSLARFDLVERVVKRLKPLARLHRIEGGDHSFRVRGAKRQDVDIGLQVGKVAASFIRQVVLQ